MRQRGFNLIEVVIVIVVVSIAAVGLMSVYGEGAETFGINEEVQTGAQLAHACSEHVLEFRRDNSPSRGYDNIPLGSGVAICDSLPLIAGYTRTVDITDFTTSPPCVTATPGSCRQVAVTVRRSGVTRAQTTFLLQNY